MTDVTPPPAAPKPIRIPPIVTMESKEFWEAADREELIGQAVDKIRAVTGLTAQIAEFVTITGDLTNRQERLPLKIQSASVSWGQFEQVFYGGALIVAVVLSQLAARARARGAARAGPRHRPRHPPHRPDRRRQDPGRVDRKSTRLNSSHT